MDQSESLTPVTRYAYLPSTEAIAEVRVLGDDDWPGNPLVVVAAVYDSLEGKLLPEHSHFGHRLRFPSSSLFETSKACLEAHLQSLEDGRAQSMEQIKALDLQIDKLEGRIDLTKKALERVCPVENQDSTT